MKYFFILRLHDVNKDGCIEKKEAEEVFIVKLNEDAKHPREDLSRVL